MGDAADNAGEIDERAMAKLEEQLQAERQRRIAMSMHGYDPSKPVNCTDCGEIVSQRRLEAYPHTRRCTKCASEVERSYRRSIPT